MEENPKKIEDEVEILDFDDDIIIDEPSKEDNIVIEEIIPEVEKERKEIIEPIEIEEIKIDSDDNTIQNPVFEEVKPNIEEKEVPITTENNNTNLLNEDLNIKSTNISNEMKNETLDIPNTTTENISNTNLLNEALNITNTSNDKSNDKEVKIETSDPVKKENVFIDNNIKEPKPIKEKTKGRGKTIFVGILIFAILLGVIIALPFINDYVNKKENIQIINNNDNNDNNNSTNTTQDFKSNIDVKKALESIKNYKNYQYQNINIISIKDNTEQLMTIKNNYVYNFNETMFEVLINKTVVDFSYEVKDYYEKLDDVYNLYVNDITTKAYTKKNTTKEEFDSIINIFPNMINYLIENYNVNEEKQIKVGNEQHTDITLKVSKEIINNMSIETNRIQNKIDSNKLEEGFIFVDLLFDKNNNLYKIEIEIEDKNAYQEQIENSVESAILKYIFTDFNKIADITLPTL